MLQRASQTAAAAEKWPPDTLIMEEAFSGFHLDLHSSNCAFFLLKRKVGELLQCYL